MKNTGGKKLKREVLFLLEEIILKNETAHNKDLPKVILSVGQIINITLGKQLDFHILIEI